jgi:hypothetical protein
MNSLRVSTTDRVVGSVLVTRLQELQQRPSLVVLASCQSVGDDAEACPDNTSALPALGHQLAEGGSPAVLAMQGSVTIQTGRNSSTVFFRELQRDGQIDQAMAVTRGAVRGQPEWWMPGLFMRLKSGRIWYAPGFIGVTSNKDLIPGVVRRALADTALLFLGFQLDDWDFRVLFRSIMSQEGRSRRSKYAHVAVQIAPEEGRILEPERARQYLERYFQGAYISIYWGSAEDFVQELHRRWKAVTP